MTSSGGDTPGVDGAASAGTVLGLMAFVAAITALLPAPPATPPAVPRTEGFVPFARDARSQEDALYPRLESWPARGPTGWRLGPASSAALRLHVDLSQRVIPLELSGALVLDAADPAAAEGSLTARARGPSAPALEALLGAPQIELTPRFDRIATPPRPQAGAVGSPWGWQVGGRALEGRVELSRSGADALRLRSIGGVALDVSAPELQSAREELARVHGGTLVSEEISLELDLHLTR